MRGEVGGGMQKGHRARADTRACGMWGALAYLLPGATLERAWVTAAGLRQGAGSEEQGTKITAARHAAPCLPMDPPSSFPGKKDPCERMERVEDRRIRSDRWGLLVTRGQKGKKSAAAAPPGDA